MRQTGQVAVAPRMVSNVGNISRRRLAGLIAAGVLLLIVMTSGFSRVALTDAAWSDSRTLSATFEAEPPAIIIPDKVTITGLRCEETQRGKPDSIGLFWEKPAEWQEFDVVYEISWQDNVLTTYSGKTTVQDETFGPFSLADYPGNGQAQHADLTFTIQAKLADGGGQSEPITIDAEGPTQGGVLRCGTSPHR